MAAVDGAPDAVAALLDTAELPDSADLLGPVDLPSGARRPPGTPAAGRVQPDAGAGAPRSGAGAGCGAAAGHRGAQRAARSAAGSGANRPVAHRVVQNPAQNPMSLGGAAPDQAETGGGMRRVIGWSIPLVLIVDWAAVAAGVQGDHEELPPTTRWCSATTRPTSWSTPTAGSTRSRPSPPSSPAGGTASSSTGTPPTRTTRACGRCPTSRR